MDRPLGTQIARMLKARGIETIFGIPGVHNIELYRGLAEAGITHVLARHEQGAGFMADGYARASGRPGVCQLITGPGLLNALTALGQAQSDSVPVLALASCLDETAALRGQLHQMRDQRAAAASVCGWSEEARDPATAYALIDRALADFATTRAGARAIHLPIGTLGAPAPDAPPPPRRAARPQATHAQLYAAIDAILSARKPLFVFGGGAIAGADAIPAVLRQTGAAAFTTHTARGLVPADHPLGFGAWLARPDSTAIFAEADLVVAIGAELSETGLWRAHPGHACPMIRVDIDPEMLAQAGPEDMPILGEAGAFLRAMAVAIPARAEDRAPTWDPARVRAARDRWEAQLGAERPGVIETSAALRAAMPDDAMIYSDMTQFAYGALECWDMPRAGHWHHPAGFGTLGYALPAAIGGAVARPGLPTVAILGDYGLQYTLPELATAVELGLSLPILVWDNAELGEIREAMIASGITPNAVTARNPDFLALARAYGAQAAQPESLDALKAALGAAFAANGPTLIRMTPAML